MSFSTALTQLITIGEGTTPTLKSAGLSPKFRHNAEGTRENPGDTRTFFFELVHLSMKGMQTAGLPRWERAILRRVVAYRQMKDQALFLRALAGDHLDLTKRYGDQTTWGQPASKIESLFLGGEQLAETDFEDFPAGGGRFAVTTFTLECRE